MYSIKQFYYNDKLINSLVVGAKVNLIINFIVEPTCACCTVDLASLSVCPSVCLSVRLSVKEIQTRIKFISQKSIAGSHTKFGHKILGSLFRPRKKIFVFHVTRPTHVKNTRPKKSFSDFSAKIGFWPCFP